AADWSDPAPARRRDDPRARTGPAFAAARPLSLSPAAERAAQRRSAAGDPRLAGYAELPAGRSGGDRHRSLQLRLGFLPRGFGASFAPQQFGLDRFPISVAAERPVAPHHAVARDQYRNVVGPVGRTRGPHRARVAGCRGQLGIGAGFAWRDAP